jgi:hypothetical protein
MSLPNIIESLLNLLLEKVLFMKNWYATNVIRKWFQYHVLAY